MLNINYFISVKINIDNYLNRSLKIIFYVIDSLKKDELKLTKYNFSIALVNAV